MDIDIMKNTKENYYFRTIIKLLLEHEVISINEVAEAINLSEKSVRNKLKAIDEYLQDNDLGQILSKPRIGTSIEVNKDNLDTLMQLVNSDQEIDVLNDGKSRQDMVLRTLFMLLPNEKTTTQKLADSLYLSTPTVLKVIKECEQYLENYNIRIINERSKGISLLCSESEYRIAVKEFLVNRSDTHRELNGCIKDFFSNVNLDAVRKSILDTEKDWNYNFTDESFYEILILLSLAYQRRSFAAPTTISYQDIGFIEKYDEYAFTTAIFRKLESLANVRFAEEEILFLTTQIMSSKFMDINQNHDTLSIIYQYDKKLITFVEEMIAMIGSILNKDLSQDQKLKESLIFHLRPTIFRLRYGSPQSNSLINIIKQEYKNVFRATWSVSILFEKYYDVSITEDEIGFIVLYIQAALERLQHSYSAVLISDFNRGHADLINSRLKRNIPEITSIEVVSRHDFKINEHRDKDLIISTGNMSQQTQDPRIVVIENLLSSEGILILKDHMRKLNLKIQDTQNSFSPICHPMFSPELIFIDLDISNKQKLLEYMSEAMNKKGFVTDGFYDSVNEREMITSTAVGNSVALPHGAQAEVNQSHVAIAILKNPIVWDMHESVDIVFLLAFKMLNHQEIKKVQTFYKEYVSLIETDEKINQLREFKSNFELYEYLIK